MSKTRQFFYACQIMLKIANKQEAKPIKIVQHEIEDQKSSERLPRHLDIQVKNKERL